MFYRLLANIKEKSRKEEENAFLVTELPLTSHNLIFLLSHRSIIDFLEFRKSLKLQFNASISSVLLADLESINITCITHASPSIDSNLRMIPKKKKTFYKLIKSQRKFRNARWMRCSTRRLLILN